VRLPIIALILLAIICPLAGGYVAEGSVSPLVEGVVTTEGRGVPGVEINVWDGHTNRKAVSDGEGKFAIAGLAPGAQFALRFTPKDHRSVRADGLRFPENGNLFLGLEYAATQRGQSYSFRVSSNPSTGYEWFLLQQGDTAVAAFRGNAMESEETPDQAELQSPKKGEFSSVPVSVGSSAGRGGWERWTFQAFGEGQSVIVLGYCRPWETEVSPARYHLFSLLVR